MDTKQETLPAEAAPDTPSETCEVIVTLVFFRRFPKLHKTLTCKRPASFCTINICCGSRTMVCKLHHDLVMAHPEARIACPECGAYSTELIWDTVS